MVYDVSYKTLLASKPLHIKFGEVDGFIRVYDGIRYSVFFAPEKHDPTSNRIRYLISQKISIIYVFSNNYKKIKVDSYESLLLKKTLTFHNVITFIKPFLNKDKN